MKRFGILIITLFVLLFIGLFLDKISAYATIGLILYIPIIFILASLNLLKGERKFRGRKLLVTLSVLSLILITSTELLGRIYVEFWSFSEQIYYISVILFISSCIVVLINNLGDIFSSSEIATDIVILLIPLSAFFYTNFILSSDFVHKKYISQIDGLSEELYRTNMLILEKPLTEFDFYSDEDIKHLYFGSLIGLIDSTFNKVAEYSGGYSPENPTRLHIPHNSTAPNYALAHHNFLQKINNELVNLIGNEQSELIKNELIRLKKNIFNKSAHNNTATEMKIRCYISINRLLWLENEKRKSLTFSKNP